MDVTPAFQLFYYTLTGAAGRISPPNASVVMYNVTRLRIWMRPADVGGYYPMLDVSLNGLEEPVLVSHICSIACRAWEADTRRPPTC
jgi:hypothetical protein